ncbi:MAG: glutathione-disulfide reductase, partial [Alphaproteobacteria bacterium]|nr:glutathione-disulfide reductase [Alphaproteobacteria bacterium]
CVPKKLLVIGAHFHDDFEDAAGFGWRLEKPLHDWPALIRAKNKELERLEGVYRRILRENKVELIEGRARLKGPNAAEVSGRAVSAANILIAAGGRPDLPQIPGIEHAITSDEALDLPALPRRVVIVGGGYIAVEFAGIFRALGAEVTIVIRAGQILRGFDDDIRESLAAEMAKKGIAIRAESIVRSIEKTNTGLSPRLAGGDALECDCVLYATGRRPNTENLGLAETGVALNERGAVQVDAYSRTQVPSIWAVGDVTDRMNLTPVALSEAMALARTLFQGHPTAMDYANVPTAVFSQPPVGTVGLTEAEAAKKAEIDVYVSSFKPMKHTLSGRDERAFLKLVVDRATDRVLGLHMMGADAPEIVQGFAVALKCGATKAQFDATVGIHPTAAEEFVTLREKRPAK